MRIGWTIASGDIANMSNDEQQDPDQDKLDGLTDVNSEPDFGAGATQAARHFGVGVSDYFDEPGMLEDVTQDAPWNRDGIWLDWSPQSWKTTLVANVDPRTLHPTQKRLFKKYLDPYIKDSMEDPNGRHFNDLPWVVEYKGIRWIVDGHHRLASAIAKNDFSVKVHLRNMDNADPDRPWHGTYAANADELATEPMGYDDNDMDDFNTGTTGPTVTQTDINPDNSYSGSKVRRLASGRIVGANQYTTYGRDRQGPAGAPRNIAKGRGYTDGPYYHATDFAAEILRGGFLTKGAESWEIQDAGSMEEFKSFGSVNQVWLSKDPKEVGPHEFGPGYGSHVLEVWAKPGKVVNGGGKTLAGGYYVNDPANVIPILQERTSSWDDVQSKAQRIYKDGGVRIISVTGPYIAAHVLGTDGTYETTLQRGQTGSIDQWTCSCPWFAYSFGRSGRWKKYEGRMCSHALALQYQAQSEGMFGREIKEQPTSPGWDSEITYYEAPPPKDWRASKTAVLPTPATKAYLRIFAAEEPRDDDGKWTKGMGDSGYGKITPGEARGDSKKVTPQEFDALAERGKAHYDRLLADKRPTTAFDDEDEWEKIRSGAFDSAQESWGGQTIDPATGRAIERSKGFSLQVRAPGEKQLTVPEDASEEEFNDMMDRARKEYATKLKGAEVYLGVFRDDDNNRIDFDPVTIVDSEAEVDSLGAYTHAVGGAYDFATGNGHFPPHVASLSSDTKEAVHVWSTIKVNNQKALPNPEHDGFRYAFHQILGDVGSFRYNASNPDFLKGENEATVFLKAFMDNQVPSHRPLYRAMGLHPAAYMTILTAANSGSIDLPPSSWSANKSLTEQFGLDYMHGTMKYEERIIFVTRPGSSSWALGRASNTGFEREHIVGGRFHVVSIKFPPETDNTTIITLQETEGWPDDFGAKGDLIEHMAFDSAVVSPQDEGKTSRYLTIDEARAGAIDYSIPMTAADKVDPHRGIMVAVRPPDVVCDELVLSDPDAEAVEQLHVTLAYIGPEESEGLDLDLLRQVVEAQSQLSPYIPATLAGHGTFENPDEDVSVVLVDSEELQVARALLVSALDRAGIEISREHGFTPHITLTYGEHGDLPHVDKQPFYFTEFIISPPSGEWEHYELATNISLGASLVVADQENPIPPTHNAEPSWGSTPIDQDDPSGSPADSGDDFGSALPGAQAVLDEEPEGALPSTDGDAGSDGAQSDQDYYPTDEQDNTHLYGGEGAAPSTIAWLDPRISNQEMTKDVDSMDIAKAAKDYLMTSEAVKTFSFAEQQAMISEGEAEGVVASNLDRLDLRNTHYEALEVQLARAEAIGEPVYWWDE